MVAYPLNKFLLRFVLVVIFLRLFTELPRSLTEVGIAEIPDLDLNRVVSGILILTILVSFILRKKLHIPHLPKQFIVVLLIFFLFSLINSFLTFTMIGMSFSGIGVVMMRYALEICVAIFAWNFIQSKNDLSPLRFYFYTPALWIIIAITMFQIATSAYGSAQGIDRLIGPFGNPNTLAMFVHLFVLLTFAFYWEEKSIIFWVLIVFQYLILFATGSITVLFANLLFLGLIGAHRRWYKLKIFYFLMPAACVILVSVFIVKWPSIANRLSIIFNLETLELQPGSSILWRIQAWDYYIGLLDSPIRWLIGVGVGVQRFIYLVGYPGNKAIVFEAPGTHNDYLAILVDFGILGLVIFWMSFFYLNKYLKKMEALHEPIRYFRYWLYSVLFAMLSENVIDQLVVVIFIFFLVSFCKMAYLKNANEIN